MPRLSRVTTYKIIFEHYAQTEEQDSNTTAAGTAGLLLRLSAVRADTEGPAGQTEGLEGNSRLSGHLGGSHGAGHQGEGERARQSSPVETPVRHEVGGVDEAAGKVLPVARRGVSPLPSAV